MFELNRVHGAVWMNARVLIVVSAAWAAGSALAATYRCTGADGKVTFSDTACPTSHKGGAVSVRPVAPNRAKPPPLTLSGTSEEAITRRNAQYETLLTPECRKARQAYAAKAGQPGGADELAEEGNLVARAWLDCEFEAKDAIHKVNAQERARIGAENQRRRELEQAQQRRAACEAKRGALRERQARTAKPSEEDRAILADLAREAQAACG
jgi:hypothetical protein